MAGGEGQQGRPAVLNQAPDARDEAQAHVTGGGVLPLEVAEALAAKLSQVDIHAADADTHVLQVPDSLRADDVAPAVVAGAKQARRDGGDRPVSLHRDGGGRTPGSKRRKSGCQQCEPDGYQYIHAPVVST